MPQALPFIGAGLGVLDTVEGAISQGKQRKALQQEMDAAQAQRRLGKLLGRQGAVGNPFGQTYAPMFEGSL